MSSSDSLLGIIFFVLLILLFPLFIYLAHRLKRYDEENPITIKFCPKCIKETLPESCGNLSSTNFIGTTLKNLDQRCSICNSYVAEHRWSIFGIPIKVYGKYRVLSIPRESSISPISINTTFISRKIKDS